MAIHKKEAFTQKEQDLAEFAKALAHPARIAILKVLAQRNECICGEIVDILPLAQSTVSQHLSKLKEAGLITSLPDGLCQRYRLNEEALNELNLQYHLMLNTIRELSKTKIEEEAPDLGCVKRYYFSQLLREIYLGSMGRFWII